MIKIYDENLERNTNYMRTKMKPLYYQEEKFWGEMIFDLNWLTNEWEMLENRYPKERKVPDELKYLY